MLVRHVTYQKAFKLLGLSDVNPAVFFNHFDMFYLIVESVKPNIAEITEKNRKCLQKAWAIKQNQGIPGYLQIRTASVPLQSHMSEGDEGDFSQKQK